MRRFLLGGVAATAIVLLTGAIAFADTVGHYLTVGSNYVWDTAYEWVLTDMGYTVSHQYDQSTIVNENSTTSATFINVGFSDGQVNTPGHSVEYGPFYIVDSSNPDNTQFYPDLGCIDIVGETYVFWTYKTVNAPSQKWPFTQMYTYTDGCATNPATHQEVFVLQ